MTDGGVWRDDELAGAVLKDNVHDAVVVFELKDARVIFGGDEGLLEGFECCVGFAAEGGFVNHGSSLAGWGCGVAKWDVFGGDEGLDAGEDVVADDADRGEILAFGVGEGPVVAAETGDVGALVAAAHGDEEL